MRPMSASFHEPPPGQHDSLDRIAEAVNYNDWIVKRMRAFVGDRVLDFGAGIGTITAALAEHAEVVALEPDPLFAARLHERFADDGRVRVVASDASWLRTADPDEIFDTIVCFNVLEHIADDELVLRGFRERLRPGGHVMLLVPAHAALYGEIDRNVGHERRYSRSSLDAVLRRVGLESAEMRYVNPVGALGWLVSSRVMKHTQVPGAPLRVYDSLVPLLRHLDRLQLPFGLSVWAVARKADSTEE